MCRIAGAGGKRVRTRTLASLAISGDGERWTLINALPDLRAQIHPRQLEAVVLTGGEIDDTAGLL